MRTRGYLRGQHRGIAPPTTIIHIAPISTRRPSSDAYDKDVAERVSKAAASTDVIAGLLRPGLPVKELNETVKRHFGEEGFGTVAVGCGHEMGIDFPPDWVGAFEYDPMSALNVDRDFEPGRK